MANAFYEPPIAYNESVLSYAPGSSERKEVQAELKNLLGQKRNVKMVIGGKKVSTGNTADLIQPHDLSHKLGTYDVGDASHVSDAIDAALAAKDKWAAMPWQERAAIFLKAADLLSGPYRARMNAATMLCQSKNVYQAEIDSVAEMCDFFRYNVQFMTDIYAQQPESSDGVWNRLEHRPLEGFVFALTPFNFTSITANLCAAPAMLGNVVVWKPSEAQIYSAEVIMDLFAEAGLPDGVINIVYVDGPTAGDVIFNHRDFAGLHFTGSTGVFRKLWQIIGNNIGKYRSYPRIVGETGGKDFVIAHPSSNATQVAVALTRGSFEYQGQKCSAASRAYVPESLWPVVKEMMVKDVKSFKMGSPTNFGNFINAVITEASFDKISSYLDKAKSDKDAEIIVGGGYSKKDGFFIEPTVIVASDPKYTTMCEELFGPVLTVYVYPDDQWSETLKMVDETSDYALTGAVFSTDRYAVLEATEALKNAAGNFYINDKPTGAVVGQQPFGGARGSGTNDKAGSILNLLRWISPRTIKETFVAAKDYKYPFLEE